jgi:hypothetical protein
MVRPRIAQNATFTYRRLYPETPAHDSRCGGLHYLLISRRHERSDDDRALKPLSGEAFLDHSVELPGLDERTDSSNATAPVHYRATAYPYHGNPSHAKSDIAVSSLVLRPEEESRTFV